MYLDVIACATNAFVYKSTAALAWSTFVIEFAYAAFTLPNSFFTAFKASARLSSLTLAF